MSSLRSTVRTADRQSHREDNIDNHINMNANKLTINIPTQQGKNNRIKNTKNMTKDKIRSSHPKYTTNILPTIQKCQQRTKSFYEKITQVNKTKAL
jgi:hypothetical protein